ncbi:MAG: hypothetical protein JKZ01_09405 [SAR324 cluster bacterium]|nr:hypothetical protein [SAR324 cluster bacterium]
MARLTFSNVPTAGGGVISGNISTGPGSPFGAGGQYEAQVSDIQATIAQAPPGFYDPVGWDKFLRESEQIGLEPTRVDDPEIMEDLLNIPSAREAMIGLAQLGLGYGGRAWEACPKCSQAQHNEIAKKRDNFQNTIALYVNRIMTEKNAPLIQAVEEHERQLEIDQAVQIALEQAKKKAQELEMVRPPRVSVFTEPPPETVTVAPPEYVKPVKPERVSVFVSPPPRTVTVSPPGYVQPEKPERVSVFDPSTTSAFDPFGGLLEEVFGEPTVKAEPIVTDICPAFCKIIHVPTGIVSYEGNCSCGTMERYDNDPEYRVEVLTKQVEPELEPELEPEPEVPFEPEPEVPFVPEVPIVPEITTSQILPPEEQPEIIVTPTPTEERPVKWIPEPFFSLINEVFRK